MALLSLIDKTLILCLILVATSWLSGANAQSIDITVPPPLPTPPLTPTTQQIINEVQTACKETISDAEIHAPRCVSVIHESPTTLVLQGRLALSSARNALEPFDNLYIWQAVDKFKAQGYSIAFMTIDTQGGILTNPPDAPRVWYVVMIR